MLRATVNCDKRAVFKAVLVLSQCRTFAGVRLFAVLSLVALIAACSGGENTPPPSATGPVGAVAHCVHPAQSASAARNAQSTGTSNAQSTGTSIDCSQQTCLSSCTPNSNGVIEVGSSGCGGVNGIVFLDPGKTLSEPYVQIDGGSTLDIPDPAPQTTEELDTPGILVQGKLRSCSTGANALAYNSAHPSAPISTSGLVTIKLVEPMGMQSPPGTATPKSIDVQGGALDFEGMKGAATFGGVSWTYLFMPAGPSSYSKANNVLSPVVGNTTLQLADDVSKDWQTGDWIVVASTDFVADSSEFVQIASVASNSNCIKSGASQSPCSTVMLMQPLVNYHFGGPAPDTGLLTARCTDSGGNTYQAGSPAAFCDGSSQNFGVDERAEVGLISRSIKLTAVNPSSGAHLHFGGEVRVEQSAAPSQEIIIQGAELEKFGKDQTGSYPITLNSVDGTKTKTVIASNSIHHSYNHGIVLNGASNVTIQGNVVARAVGHLFYEVTGTEQSVTFQSNLGVGAMNNAFPSSPPVLMYFWNGDNLGNPSLSPTYGYDGFNLPFTDPANVTGGGGVSTAPACGMWISNIGTVLTGNSIAGVQGVGTGIQYIPPIGSQPQAAPSGTTFTSNRVHGAYVGVDTAAGPAPGGFLGDNFLPVNSSHQDTVFTFEGLTATRNRQLGLWARPAFSLVDNSQFANNREALALVSSGGAEGSPPGEWALLENSIVVGESQNNPGRFGPCPSVAATGCFGEPFGGNGYPTPGWGFLGYMFYDGPARLEGDKFVNFNTDITPYLTTGNVTTGPDSNGDASFLNFYNTTQSMPTANTSSVSSGVNTPFVYTGDAALGWFQSNVNNYPPTQYTEDLHYVNVDLRHRVYTQEVNNGPFVDGDKFTVIVDRDGSLSGYGVVDANGNPIPPPGSQEGKNGNVVEAPFSLNNLPFVGTPNSADELESAGLQDCTFEKRPTSLMSPEDYATLELSIQTPGDGKFLDNNKVCGGSTKPISNTPCSCASDPTGINCNQILVEKDEPDYSGTPQFDLDGLGPTVASLGTMNPDGTSTTWKPKTMYQLGDIVIGMTSGGGNWEEKVTTVGTSGCYGGNGPPPCPAVPSWPAQLGMTFTDGTVIWTNEGILNGLAVVACTLNHSCVSLAGRNQQGVYEPKVVNGLGYTVRAQSYPLPSFLDVGFLDAPVRTRTVSDANIAAGGATLSSMTASFTQRDVGDLVSIKGAGPSGSDLETTIKDYVSAASVTVANAPIGGLSNGTVMITRPFTVRLGICYNTASGTAPPDVSHFTVKAGHKSYGAPSAGKAEVFPTDLWQMLACSNLDFSENGGLGSSGQECSMNPPPGTLGCYLTDCPSSPVAELATKEDVTPATIPSPLDPGTIYYDSNAGMLFFEIQQAEPNAVGPSPLSCNGSSPCPDFAHDESFYPCPADGCVVYTVEADSTYQPNGPSSCSPYSGGSGGMGYTLSYPLGMNQLVNASTNAIVQVTAHNASIATTLLPNGQNFPHNVDNAAVAQCP